MIGPISYHRANIYSTLHLRDTTHVVYFMEGVSVLDRHRFYPRQFGQKHNFFASLFLTLVCRLGPSTTMMSSQKTSCFPAGLQVRTVVMLCFLYGRQLLSRSPAGQHVQYCGVALSTWVPLLRAPFSYQHFGLHTFDNALGRCGVRLQDL